MIPLRETYYSIVAYVTYTWVSIYAHRELQLDKDLPIEIPVGFEELRKEILSFADSVADIDKIADEGHMGLFAVYTHDLGGEYVPPKLSERYTVSAYPFLLLHVFLPSKI